MVKDNFSFNRSKFFVLHLQLSSTYSVCDRAIIRFLASILMMISVCFNFCFGFITQYLHVLSCLWNSQIYEPEQEAECIFPYRSKKKPDSHGLKNLSETVWTCDIGWNCDSGAGDTGNTNSWMASTVVGPLLWPVSMRVLASYDVQCSKAPAAGPS